MFTTLWGLSLTNFMGFVVDEDDVAGLIEERHGPIGKGSSGGTDDLTGRRIDGYTVSFDESPDMEGTLMGKDGIGALGELIGLLKATDTNGKTGGIFKRQNGWYIHPARGRAYNPAARGCSGYFSRSR